MRFSGRLLEAASSLDWFNSAPAAANPVVFKNSRRSIPMSFQCRIPSAPGTSISTGRPGYHATRARPKSQSFSSAYLNAPRLPPNAIRSTLYAVSNNYRLLAVIASEAKPSAAISLPAIRSTLHAFFRLLSPAYFPQKSGSGRYNPHQNSRYKTYSEM